MNTVQSYKCPCCGAPLTFSGEKQNLHCDACGNDFSLDTLQQLSDAQNQTQAASKFDWQRYEPRSYESDGSIDLSGYTCPSCGAEITGDDT